jgi:hypothetical protein
MAKGALTEGIQALYDVIDDAVRRVANEVERIINPPMWYRCALTEPQPPWAATRRALASRAEPRITEQSGQPIPTGDVCSRLYESNDHCGCQY